MWRNAGIMNVKYKRNRKMGNRKAKVRRCGKRKDARERNGKEAEDNKEVTVEGKKRQVIWGRR